MEFSLERAGEWRPNVMYRKGSCIGFLNVRPLDWTDYMVALVPLCVSSNECALS